MLSKSSISKWVFPLIRNMKVTKADLSSQLLSLQNTDLVPIAPFSIEDDRANSKLVDVVVSEFIDLGYVIEKSGDLALSHKGAKLWNESASSEIKSATPCTIPILQQNEKRLMEVQGKKFDVRVLAPLVVLQFTRSLPTCPEIGILCSVHPNSPILKSMIPMRIGEDKVIYAFAERSETPIEFDNFKKNFKKLKSFAYNMLRTAFDETRLLNLLEIVYYDLLPYSAIRLEAICSSHHQDAKYFDDYIEAFLYPVQRVCRQEGCFSRMNRVAFVSSNEKIFSSWRNGSLMEWFAAALLWKAGASDFVWNAEVLGEECDAVAVKDQQLTVVQCKRTGAYDTNYQDGLSQLRSIRAKFKNMGVEAKTVLFTTIAEEPREEKDIDLVVTVNNYLDFCKKPYSLL